MFIRFINLKYYDSNSGAHESQSKILLTIIHISATSNFNFFLAWLVDYLALSFVIAINFRFKHNFNCRNFYSLYQGNISRSDQLHYYTCWLIISVIRWQIGYGFFLSPFQSCCIKRNIGVIISKFINMHRSHVILDFLSITGNAEISIS